MTIELVDHNGRPARLKGQPIKPLRLTDNDGESAVLAPLEDLTVLEAHHINVLLLRCVMNRDMLIPDWRGYVNEHKLNRHFVDNAEWERRKAQQQGGESNGTT